MIVFKGFNKNLTCTSGAGVFQYRLGETATAEKAKVGQTGLHAYEEPLMILKWYGFERGAHCVCSAEGDITEVEDGRIACTKLTLIKVLTPVELAIHECRYIMKHPMRPTHDLVKRDYGEGNNPIVMVRGKNPTALGKNGQTVFLLKEAENDPSITSVFVYEIDGVENPEGRYGECGYDEARTDEAENS